MCLFRLEGLLAILLLLLLLAAAVVVFLVPILTLATTDCPSSDGAMASVAVVAAAVRSPALGVIMLCLQLRFTLRRMRRTLVLPSKSARSY